MPLQLPNLDNRRYDDLIAEARRLITVYDPDWTNHNPSDPGITLLELFAYLTEMLLYRLDRVTVENQRKFLKLLNGPDWQPGTDPAADIRASVLATRARERAVIAADFERLATEDFNQWLGKLQRTEQDPETLKEWRRVMKFDPQKPPPFLPSAVPFVARAQCAPSQNLERRTEAERTQYAPGHVSVIILPKVTDRTGGLQPPTTLKDALWGYLDDWRMLTTRHHVVGPLFAPIDAEIVIAAAGGALVDKVRARVIEQIENFLDPLPSSTAQEGWPFGRDVYASELYEQIEAVEGVDYITDLMLFSTCHPTDKHCVAATPLWHAEGDLIGLKLASHHLPLARFDPNKIIISSTGHGD
ncbi:MAG: hypothetical protein U1F76_06240 [Candidatus Competibacteraceae bacterium]